MANRKTAFSYILAASPLFVAFLLYGYTLSLPFFLDDGPNYHLLDHIDGIEQWAGSEAHGFYRPLPFTLWKIGAKLSGRYDPVSMHLLNLLCFGMTGVVINQIVQRMMPRSEGRVAGWFAAMGYMFFPFSYQAVPLVSAVFHLTVALGVTLAMWAALLWLDERAGIPVLVLCWLSTIFGVFSLENGVLVAPLTVGLIVVTYRGQWPSLRRIVWVVLPVSLIAGVYTLLWLTLPRFTNYQDKPVFNYWAYQAPLGHFLQGLVYPVPALVRVLVGGSSTIEPTQVIWLVATVVVATLAWIWWKSRIAGAVATFGVIWYVLGISPSVFLLEPGYVLGSPRLMHFASIGAGIFGGVIMALVFRLTTRYQTRVKWLVRGSLVAVPLVVSLSFLNMRYQDYTHMSNYTWRLFDLFQAQDITQADLLIVNSPNYLAPIEPTFLLGAEGVTFMLNNIIYEQQFWVNTGVDFDATGATIDVISHRNTRKYPSRIFAAHKYFVDEPELSERLHSASQIYATHFQGSDFLPVFVGGPDLPGPDSPIVTFPEIDLHLTQLEASFSPERQTLTVRSRWEVDEPAPIKLFVHAFCDGVLVGQSDGYPWGDMYSFDRWQPGEIQTDIRELWLAGPVNAACLQIYAGVYWEANVVRLTPVDQETQQPYENGIIPVSLVRVTDDLIPFPVSEE